MFYNAEQRKKMKVITSFQYQTGAVLAISMLTVLIMTILGISAMGNNIMEEKMVNNDRHYKTAMHAAELALREAENQIDPDATYSNILTTSTPNNGLYLASTPSTVWWESVNWDNASQVRTSLSSTSDRPLNYIVEQLPVPASAKDSKEAGTALKKNYYRLTSRALVEGTKAKVMLQSTFKK